MEIITKVDSISHSSLFNNLVCKNPDDTIINLKIDLNCNDIIIGEIYLFNYNVVEKERTSYHVTSYTLIDNLPLEKKDEALRMYQKGSKYNLNELIDGVTKYKNKIKNKIIKNIVDDIFNKYHDDFFVYPAATRMHHIYVGGLATHTLGMLKMADSYLINYDYLNSDYLYAGIILHDVGKILELSGNIDTQYTLKGKLLGHLVMGESLIANTAEKLGYSDEEEVLLLEHMIVAHHGLSEYGSPKKPMTAEAFVLWYIDTMDSKLCVLGERLKETKNGEFTEQIGVIDRQKFYKNK